MDSDILKQLKSQIDKTLGDQQTEILSELLEQSEKTGKNISELSEVIQNNNKDYLQTLEVLRILMTSVINANENLLKSINKLPSEIKFEFPKEIDVKNFPEPEKFPDKININNLPETKDFPKEISVNNLKDLKLPTSIKLEKIDFPEILNKKELIDVLSIFIKNLNRGGLTANLDRYQDPNKPLAVRLSNGKNFYTAFSQAISQIGGSAFPFETAQKIAKAALVDTDGHQQMDIVSMPAISVDPEDSYNTNHLDDATTADVTYIGMENSAGVWLIKKIDESGSFPVFTYANISLNSSLTTYALAWADRVTAVYDTYADAT